MCARRNDPSEDRELLLTDLSQFAGGGASEFPPAQDRDQFFKAHLPIAEHQRVLDRQTLLVLGGRGTGKTQLFRALRELDNPAELLSPPIRSDRAVPREQYTAGFGGAGRLFPRKEVLTSLLSTGQLSAPERLWAGMLAGVMLQHGLTKSAVSTVLSLELQQLLGHELSTPSRWLSAIAEPDAYNTLHNALDAADRTLEDQKRTLTVTYDDLDRLVSEMSSAYPLIRGLLAFWLDNVRRWSAIRCKIFLRTDIFAAEEIAFTDSSKLRPLSVTLRWSADNLYRLVLKRLLNGDRQREWLQFIGRSVPKARLDKREPWGIVPTTDENDHRAFMERVVGQYMGSEKRRGDTYRWFLNHLQDSLRDIAPRSFLKLFEMSAGRQMSSGLPDSTRLLAPEQVNAALMEVSEDRIVELKEEFKGIEGIGSNLRDQVVPMKRSDFHRCLRDIDWEKFPEHVRDSKDSLINYLMNLGILRETSDKRIHVPDIYLFGFGLKRKGGIRRPRA